MWVEAGKVRSSSHRRIRAPRERAHFRTESCAPASSRRASRSYTHRNDMSRELRALYLFCPRTRTTYRRFCRTTFLSYDIFVVRHFCHTTFLSYDKIVCTSSAVLRSRSSLFHLSVRRPLFVALGCRCFRSSFRNDLLHTFTNHKPQYKNNESNH